MSSLCFLLWSSTEYMLRNEALESNMYEGNAKTRRPNGFGEFGSSTLALQCTELWQHSLQLILDWIQPDFRRVGTLQRYRDLLQPFLQTDFQL